MRDALAALLTGTAIAAAASAGGEFGPTPAHPGTAAWYARLRKPNFTPPGPVFGIVWPLLDVLLWYGGYRLLRHPPGARRNLALGLWGATCLGVGAYSWVFFGRRSIRGAVGVTGAMVVTASGLTATAATLDRRAAGAIAPLALWVTFAFLLQEEVWRRNR